MQSEMASHIGLRGRCFCRVCHVQGGPRARRKRGGGGDEDDESDYDADDEDGDEQDDDLTDSLSASRAASPALSVNTNVGSSHPKYQWTVPGIVDRLSAFIRVSVSSGFCEVYLFNK